MVRIDRVGKRRIKSEGDVESNIDYGGEWEREGLEMKEKGRE